jgi:putative transcriptional regulator
MDKQEFIRVRNHLRKTQTQMAQLLGTSGKAVESYEQGWRRIPVHFERQVLFLLSMKGPRDEGTPCWILQDCPVEMRNKCPAWEFQAGHYCWFINGTMCQGKKQKNWETKMKMCRKCEVFRSLLSF